MGMFDYIKCRYYLPVPNLNEREFQTKDTPRQLLDNYEIREDGTLWVETHQIEDQSPRGVWERKNPGKMPPKRFSQLDALYGCMTKINQSWTLCDFSGEISFCDFHEDDKGWIEFRAEFDQGVLVGEIECIKNVRKE